MAAIKYYQYELNVVSYINNELKNDKEVVMAAINKNVYELEYVSKELKNNKEVVMAAVTNNGFALQYASERLRDDKEVVMAAVNNSVCSLEYASERLRDDKEMVMTAVNKYGDTLKYASERLRDDNEVVMIALTSSYVVTLQYASERLRNDRDTVSFAFKQNSDSWWVICDELRNDPWLLLPPIVKFKRLALLALKHHRIDRYYKESLAPNNMVSFFDTIETDECFDHIPPVPPFLERVWKKRKCQE